MTALAHVADVYLIIAIILDEHKFPHGITHITPLFKRYLNQLVHIILLYLLSTNNALFDCSGYAAAA